MLIEGLVVERSNIWVGKRDGRPARSLTVWDKTAGQVKVTVKGEPDLSLEAQRALLEALPCDKRVVVQVRRVFANAYPNGQGASASFEALSVQEALPE